MKHHTTLALALAGCGGSTDVHVKTVEDLGGFPLPSTVTTGRDGGQSGVLAGLSLWTFGDTFTSQPNTIDGSHLLSATAGWSTPAAPLALVQPVGSDGIPAQLIPYTADEIAANEADAQTGWALWPSGLLDTGDPQRLGLVPFQRVLRGGTAGFSTVAVATARIAMNATVAMRGSGDLFSAPEPLFIPGLVDGGYVYAIACAPSGFLDQSCQLARAPVMTADQRAAYEFWDGGDYTTDITRAATFIDRGNGPSIAWNAHLGRYLSVVSEVVSSTVLLRTAPAIEGPWDDGTELQPSDCGILPPTSSSDYDYLAMEHAELASPDGTQIVISYSRPTTEFGGEVRLARVTLE
jgi:hypothetical protein